ncbi:MAG: hypothetical protein RSD67_08315 [Oscillospiraceae bacterium]
MSKCMFCKQEITDMSTAYKFVADSGRGQYYCSKEHWQEQQNKKQLKSPATNPIVGESQLRKLTDWLQEYYILQGYEKNMINWQLITAHLKNIMNTDKNIKYSGILYTLKYLVNVKDMDLLNNESGSILGLVLSNYLPAKLYFEETQEIKKSIDNFKFDENVKVVQKSIDNRSTNVVL